MGVIDFIKAKTTQKAVYWGTPTNDGRGKYTFAVVEEVNVRWEDEQETFAKDSRSRVRIDKDGREFRSSAIIYCATQPTGGWDLDGHLFLGELTDLEDSSTPYGTTGAYEIKNIETLPSLSDTSLKMYVIYL